MRTRSRPSLYFTDRGEGEPVLLITGWMISSAVFDPIAHLYVERARIIAHDHRGTGRSQRWSGPVSAALLAAETRRGSWMKQASQARTSSVCHSEQRSHWSSQCACPSA